MKKNIIKSFFIVAVVAIASININVNSKTNSEITNLVNLNMAAIADAECTPSGHIAPAMWSIYFHTSCHWTCTPGGTQYCPI